MILVRDIFQVKFGKMKEAKAIWQEMTKLVSIPAGSQPSRLLTDLTGPYYTLVLESTFRDLKEYELRQPGGGDAGAKMGALYQKLVPLVDSGRREIFTIVD